MKLFNGETSVSLDYHGQEIVGTIESLSGVEVTSVTLPSRDVVGEDEIADA